MREADPYHPKHQKTEDVLEAFVTNVAADNVNTNLNALGKRMDALIDAGLTASEARAQAMDELLGRLSRQKRADILDRSKGAVDATTANARESIKEARRLHLMTLDIPLNPLAEFTVDAEPPADYYEEYLIGEYVYSSEPNPHEPPRPQYAVVVEAYGPGQNYSYEFAGLEVERFEAVEGVIDHLYESEYFWSVERATEWKDRLEDIFDVTIETPPEDRINPDAESA